MHTKSLLKRPFFFNCRRDSLKRKPLSCSNIGNKLYKHHIAMINAYHRESFILKFPFENFYLPADCHFVDQIVTPTQFLHSLRSPLGSTWTEISSDCAWIRASSSSPQQVQILMSRRGVFKSRASWLFTQ